MPFNLPKFPDELRGMEKVDFFPQTAPPTFDDIYNSFKSDKLICQSNVESLIRDEGKVLSEHVEQFNFGRLTEDAIMEAGREALDFIEAGLLCLPYSVCYYRCTIEYPQEVEGRRHAGVGLFLVTDKLGATNGGFRCVDFCKSISGHIMAVYTKNHMKVCLDENGDRALQLSISNNEVAFWKSRLRGPGGLPPTERHIADGAMLAVGLTMILNTKGIRKERTEPPRKPNIMRARAGKPLLPWVTRVYTDVYRQAIAPGVGTHASPRPHRRRAHVRTYPPRDGREGYSIPIAAMLVNWDGKPLERGQYEVKHEEP